jgi:hypothetical protein
MKIKEMIPLTGWYEMKRFVMSSMLVVLVSFGSLRDARGRPAPAGSGRAKAARATRSVKARAKKLFGRGRRFFRRKRYQKALEYFQRAYETWKHPVILYNIALCHAFLDDKIEAAIRLRQYQKQTKKKEKLPAILERIRKQTGVLVIEAAGSDAKIYVDGKPVGREKVELVVMAGQRAVDVRVENTVVAQKTVDVPGGGKKKWEVKNLPRPGPSASEQHPEDEPRPGFAAGAPSGGSGVSTVEKEDELGRFHWAYFTAALGVAVGAGATALALHFRTNEIRDDYVAGGQTDADLRKKGIRYYWASSAMWGVAGAFALTAGVLAVFTKWSTSSEEREAGPAVSVMPAVGPESVGLTLRLTH